MMQDGRNPATEGFDGRTPLRLPKHGKDIDIDGDGDEVILAIDIPERMGIGEIDSFQDMELVSTG